MAIAFNTGTTGNANSLTQATAFTFTIPAGVNTGDLMIVSLACFTFTSASPGIATPTSGGGNWSQVGSLADSGHTSGLDMYGTVWYRVATASDPGSTFSVTFSGSQGSSNQFWWAAAMGAYSGAASSQPDVQGNAVGLVVTINDPSETTGVAGDWGLYLAQLGNGNGQFNAQRAAGTLREATCSTSDVGASLYDSNGSLGGSGTSFGNATWSSTSGSSGSWWTVFTVGLAPASGQTNTATAALSVTPTLAAAATRTALPTAALSVTPTLAAAVTHTALTGAALALTVPRHATGFNPHSAAPWQYFYPVNSGTWGGWQPGNTGQWGSVVNQE